MGRRKIEMKMVVDSGCRQVTFSKRRTGLFKKANELATLCGAEVAVVVFSPGGKPFSFGQPTVEAVANRFLAGNDASPMKKVSKRDAAAVEKLNNTLNEKTRQLHEEKAIAEAIDKDIKVWKSSDFDSMEFDELVRLRNSLEELHETTTECVSEIEASSTLLMLSNDDFFKSQP